MKAPGPPASPGGGWSILSTVKQKWKVVVDVVVDVDVVVVAVVAVVAVCLMEMNGKWLSLTRLQSSSIISTE